MDAFMEVGAQLMDAGLSTACHARKTPLSAIDMLLQKLRGEHTFSIAGPAEPIRTYNLRVNIAARRNALQGESSQALSAFDGRSLDTACQRKGEDQACQKHGEVHYELHVE